MIVALLPDTGERYLSTICMLLRNTLCNNAAFLQIKTTAPLDSNDCRHTVVWIKRSGCLNLVEQPFEAVQLVR